MLNQKLGEILLWAGIIDQAQLDSALRRQYETGEKIGKILIESQAVSEKVLADLISLQRGFRRLQNFEYDNLDHGMFRYIPIDVCLKFRIVPYRLTAEGLLVATDDPLNFPAIDIMHYVAKQKIITALVETNQLDSVLKRLSTAKEIFPNEVQLKVGGRVIYVPATIVDKPAQIELENVPERTDYVPGSVKFEPITSFDVPFAPISQSATPVDFLEEVFIDASDTDAFFDKKLAKSYVGNNVFDQYKPAPLKDAFSEKHTQINDSVVTTDSDEHYYEFPYEISSMVSEEIQDSNGEFLQPANAFPVIKSSRVHHQTDDFSFAPPSEPLTARRKTTFDIEDMVVHIITVARKTHAQRVVFELRSEKIRTFLRINGTNVEEFVIPGFFAHFVADYFDERVENDSSRFLLALPQLKQTFKAQIIREASLQKVIIDIEAAPLAMQFYTLNFAPAERELVVDALHKRTGVIVIASDIENGKTTTMRSIIQLFVLQKQKIALFDSSSASSDLEDPIARFPVSTLFTFDSSNFDIVVADNLKSDDHIKRLYDIALHKLVILTIEAQNAAYAIAALQKHGISATNIAARTNLIVAQKLIRVLCPVCRGIEFSPIPQEACTVCGGTGYIDNEAIFEVLNGNILQSSLDSQIRSLREIFVSAKALGYVSLWNKATERARDGIASFEDVVLNVQKMQWD